MPSLTTMHRFSTLLNRRSDRFSYGLIPFFAYFVDFKAEGLSFEQKKNKIIIITKDILPTSVVLTDVKNRSKLWKILDNIVEWVRFNIMSRCVKIATLFFHFTLSVSLFGTHSQRTGQLVSNSKVVCFFLFVCSVKYVIEYSCQLISISDFVIDDVLPSIRFIFFANFPLLFFSVFEKTLFCVKKMFSRSFFLSIDYVFMYFKFKWNTLHAFELFSRSFEREKKTYNWWKLKANEKKETSKNIQ